MTDENARQEAIDKLAARYLKTLKHENDPATEVWDKAAADYDAARLSEAVARDSMEFSLKIELGNEAMQDNHQVAEALRRTAEWIDTFGLAGHRAITDENGNTVGSCFCSEKGAS
jgi:hypothetical protein